MQLTTQLLVTHQPMRSQLLVTLSHRATLVRGARGLPEIAVHPRAALDVPPALRSPLEAPLAGRGAQHAADAGGPDAGTPAGCGEKGCSLTGLSEVETKDVQGNKRKPRF